MTRIHYETQMQTIKEKIIYEMVHIYLINTKRLSFGGTSETYIDENSLWNGIINSHPGGHFEELERMKELYFRGDIFEKHYRQFVSIIVNKSIRDFLKFSDCRFLTEKSVLGLKLFLNQYIDILEYKSAAISPTLMKSF